MQYLWIGLLAFLLLTNTQAASTSSAITQLIAQKKFDDALKKIDAALKLNPEQSQILFLRARALAGQGKTDAAIAQYKQLIEKYPKQPESYNNLAAIYVRQGKQDEAQQLLEQAMQTHPAYAAVYRNLSTLYVERARNAYGKALQLSEQNSIQLATISGLHGVQTASIKPYKNNALKQNKAAESAKTAMIFQGDTSKTDKKDNSQGSPSAVSKDDEADAVRTMQGWARAWSAKDATAYIGFYTDTYSPTGISRQSWVRQRHQRISKPNQIKVELSDMQVTALGQQKLKIRLKQDYSSDRYHDLSRKEFFLIHQNGNWKIYKERSLGFATP